MAVNDRILLDGVIDDRLEKRLPSAKRDEVFEFFAFEQLLKFADLSSDEIKSGWVDGADDGGIDGFFTFVNDHLLSDASIFNWPRGGAELSVWLVSCKHHDTFRLATVDKLVASLSELLNFSKRSQDLNGGYSTSILRSRDRLIHAYKTLANRITRFNVSIVYASRGDTAVVGDAVVARARQAEATVRELFSSSDVTFAFAGSTELVALSRKARRYSLELPFAAHFAQGERYVLLCRLEDYSRFVLDEDGNVRRYLFDSNVRDFVGLNRVNEDIAASLASDSTADFWWLNNGITILVTKAIITGNSITLDDVQVVNGLQTTESIARHFRTGGTDPRDRSVLVKIIKTEDAAVRDAIIRATNNQTAVEQQSLSATDKIQRDIEAVLLANGWYYDRRANYYANLGHPPDKIVAPMYVAAGAVALLLKAPRAASKLRQKFMRNPTYYTRVFSEEVDLAAWPKLVAVLKFVDRTLEAHRESQATRVQERFLKRWRYLVSLILIARMTGKFSFSAKDLAALDLSQLKANLVTEIWRIIERQSDAFAILAARSHSAENVRGICADAAFEYSIADVRAVDTETPFLTQFTREYKFSPTFLDKVDSALPDQPWKPGTHREVASALGCSVGKAQAAIQELISRGRRHEQRNGVVYNADGSVLAVDPERSSRPK